MLEFSSFEYLTFDCYGTLINWEQGILGVLQPILHAHNVVLSDDAVLAAYGEVEPKLQHPYRRYREVLREVVRAFGETSGFVATEAEMNALPDSLSHWSPYEDTNEALVRLKKRYKLVVLSNIDDDLFAGSAKLLQVKFDAVVTAEQVKSYKPDHAHWIEMMHRCRTAPGKVLHVGQSIYHDVVPAKALGFTTVWVHRAPGFGATRESNEQPDLEVRSLRELADLALAD